MKGLVSRLTDRAKRNSVSLPPPNGLPATNAPLPPLGPLRLPTTAPAAQRPGAHRPISYSTGPKVAPAVTQQAELAQKRKADEIARCSKLLRQMYTMDLRIWGMETVDGGDVLLREELKRRANALCAEVHKVVAAWGDQHDKWTPEEKMQIREIHSVLGRFSPNRY